MIFDIDLEKKFLAALIQNPGEWLAVNGFFSEKDLFAEDDLTHSSILTVIRQGVEKGEDIDATIVSQRVEQLGFSREGDFSVGEYVRSLALRKIGKESVLRLARELKKLSARRTIYQTGVELQDKMKSIGPSASYTEILGAADAVFNKEINSFELEGEIPVNLYDDMEAIIESAGLNQEEPLFGPFRRVNEIYGSLVKPGNICCVTSRSGIGKSQLAMDFCCYVGDRYDIPVLHFDNGEMSKEELTYRRAAAISGVPLHLLESGKWRNAGTEIVKKVRDALQKVKSGKSRFYYFSVAGMNVDEMVNVAQKFYYNKVGRGNKMILSFDYIKTTNQLGGNMTEWQVVGEIVDKFKKFVQKDILFEGNPMVGMFTSVQSNRSGVTANKTADKIIDDESTVSLSDRIIQFCSHMFILRKKTMDEIADEGPQWGTHKWICIKARHLGEDVMGHLEPVKDGDKLRQNFISLSFENFKIQEKGDLRDILKAKRTNPNLQSQQQEFSETDF